MTDVEVWTVIGILALAGFALLALLNWLKTRYHEKHPPDWADGMREERFDDDQRE